MKLSVVNIEAGMPTVEAGQKQLYFHIITAKRQGIKVLKVIHGYGSSGTGGRLKTGVHAYLAVKKKEGFIKDFIPGDSWDIFNQASRELLALYADLKKDRDLGNHNPGITMVLL
ncbi:MAG: Smr/MutS family protein [Clostridiales bacterium]|nr:Smr/MutS family protein [Clostridiales bacterium]